MTVVKISRKSEPDALVSKLTMRLGRKPTQQEVIDTCVDLGNEYFEDLVGRLNTFTVIDDAKMQRIEAAIEETKDAPWVSVKKSTLLSRDDADIYGT
ncbi:MAG: hypothetical protein RBG13Loki_1480 [Promethearchaeota archaeon CR_4]|nr:MAG: hypothetical protein RBG13Loki_1480 [Candidatus Lokiarchaeota archaeon CR_4]